MFTHKHIPTTPAFVKQMLTFAAVAGLVFALAPAAQATHLTGPYGIVAPEVLNEGDTYRLAFVTSTIRDAMSSNIADYNAFVNAAAAGSSYTGVSSTTWFAIASTETVDARDNTSTNSTVETGVPIYLLDETKIADDYADLWDATIDNPLNLTELGAAAAQPGDPLNIWTGTRTTGLAHECCNDPTGGWLGSGDNVYQAHSYQQNEDWMEVARILGNNSRSLYAISEELTAQVPVPEPAGVCLLLTGLLVLARVRF